MIFKAVLMYSWPSNIEVIVSGGKRHIYVVTSFSQLEGYESEYVIAITTCNALNDCQGYADVPLA